MSKTVTALYDDFETARRVSEDMVRAGFSRDGLSVVANDASGYYVSSLEDTAEHNAIDVEHDVSAEEGAGFGMVVGALIGIGTMFIPGIGPAIAAGPLATALLGAGVGAVAGAVTGGLVAALVHLGVPEEDVDFYAEGVRRGGALLIARVDDERVEEAVNILEDYTPVNVENRANYWRQAGWTRFDANAKPLSLEELNRERESYDTYQGIVPRLPDDMMHPQTDDFGALDTDFHSHYWAHYSDLGRTFEDYAPAYRYGYTLAHDMRYADLEWPRLEHIAQLYWEEHFEGGWDNFKDAVSYAWNRARAAV
jgi:hypothetical protein